MKNALVLILVLGLQACASAPLAEDLRTLSSEEALSWTRHKGLEAATLEDGLVIVRADPRLTPVELVNPPESGSLGIGRLASRRGFAFAINAAMFAKDYVTSIGYMRNYDNINNPRLSAKLKGFLMFNPKSEKSPPARIGTAQEMNAYHTAFQSHRMIDEAGNILWKKGASVFRQVGLVGVDKSHRVLFFYQPRRMDVHDLVSRIQALDLGLTGLIYLDGGSHGSLVLDPALGESRNTWVSLPNVLGIRGSD